MFVGLLLTFGGAFLLYAGVKDEDPREVISGVLSGRAGGEGKQRADEPPKIGAAAGDAVTRDAADKSANGVAGPIYGTSKRYPGER